MSRSYLSDKAVHFALNHPRNITWVMVITTLILLVMAALPNFVHVPYLKPVMVDTDPENMLAHDEPVRLFHDQNKQTFSLSDMVVVGVVNESHPQGVFNKDSLARIYELTQYAKTLTWPAKDNPEKREGVIEVDMIAPSSVDNIEQGGLGVVNFSWLMPKPPASDAEALLVKQRAQHIPFLNGTLVSEDGKALAIYLPLTSKTLSWRVSNAIHDYTANWSGGDEVYITGLPVAEDTFGVEMFIQMAISAPLAMLAIFLLLWWFFKKLILIASPMVVAMVSAMSTMALLIISGNTIHIMSSMIPIFVMPIAVLDAIHILSEFFDRYPQYKDRRKTLTEVMHTLFAPMLFTTITTMAGFLSLALTPIPPVQVFGIFVAIGVFIAWLLTILFIPAYVMLIPEHKLEGYGHTHSGAESAVDKSLMGRLLSGLGRGATARPGWVVLGTLLTAAVALYGISTIKINDNPIKWFGKNHEIRVADRVLNQHFGGTYMAYLALQAPQTMSVDLVALENSLAAKRQQAEQSDLPLQPFDELAAELKAVAAKRSENPLAELSQFVEDKMAASDGDAYFSWDALALMLDEERQRHEVFKQPETLRWMDQLQQALLANDKVGKINSLTDVVKTVHRELLLGEQQQYRIPDNANTVGQTLITYQNSHRPQDLWHFVTPDYRQSNMWLQLSSGDNVDMEQVVRVLDQFTAAHPAPFGIEANWFGLTYINVVWQDKMVFGMLEAFLSSFAVVLIMMIVLFRSVLMGLLSMIPLTLTVGLIYGIIGLIGKDYDMPVAVLSALSLGLAVDYAIHFLARSREAVKQYGSWNNAIQPVFGEPARAIARNAIVLSAGFLPLLAAPLVPYQTVGFFIAAIILCAGLATLLIMPALVTLLQNFLFKNVKE